LYIIAKNTVSDKSTLLIQKRIVKNSKQQPWCQKHTDHVI